MSEPSDERLSHTAVHEAGHAVIGRVLDMRCGYVTIVADEDSAGHSMVSVDLTITKWRKAGIWRGPDAELRAHILQSMAGAVANIEFGQPAIGYGSDKRVIDKALEDIYGNAGRFDHAYARLSKMAEALVRRHRARIRCVARALEHKKTLYGHEVDALIRPLRLRSEP